MNPVTQRVFHDPVKGTQGDCLRCCIATILGLEYEDVPDFTVHAGQSDFAREFLWSRGYHYLEIVNSEDLQMLGFEHVPTILSGPSPRSEDPRVGHAVVGKGFVVVHDPHPSGAGLKVIRWVKVLIPKNV